MRKPTFWFPTRSVTNQAVRLHKMARGLKIIIHKVEELYYPLICVFVFAYAKCWFSHDAAKMLTSSPTLGTVPWIRYNCMKANLTGWLCSKFENFPISTCQDMHFMKPLTHKYKIWKIYFFTSSTIRAEI